MTIQDAQLTITESLAPIYTRREAAAIATLVLAKLTGLSSIQMRIHKEQLLTSGQQLTLEEWLHALVQHTPVQYVLEEEWFAGMQLYVNNHVLIPRPETEELIHWVADTIKAENMLRPKPVSVLDIGTGSGCIALSIKKLQPAAEMYAIDFSAQALEVAQKNATLHNSAIAFKQLDILDETQWPAMPRFNFIVSNPPYITQSEATEMQANVLQHEPHSALFVPNETPLLFYDKIAQFSLKHLTAGGHLFFEINEMYGSQTMQLLLTKGFINVQLKKDLQQKDRMIKAQLP